MGSGSLRGVDLPEPSGERPVADDAIWRVEPCEMERRPPRQPYRGMGSVLCSRCGRPSPCEFYSPGCP